MSLRHLDYDALNALKDIMEDDFAFLIETFIKDSQDRLSSLRSLSGSQDSNAIRRAAHSFKGSCSNLGALQLAELCATVERSAFEARFGNIPEDIKIIEQEFNVVEKLLHEFLG